MDGFNILVDPVFSGNISPVKFFGKSFSGTDHYKVPDLPFIDLLILTHDHYDHLDYDTISKIHNKVGKIITPLGVDEHLIYWGVDPVKITTLDWWQSKSITDDIEITAAPARHFSGRSFNRDKSLWASFILKIKDFKIFIGGDSGYDDQFKIIGEKYGGFDLAFLECGQYGTDWPQIHMTPEETIKAAKELHTAILIPVHWGKFALAMHSWNEPVKRLFLEAHLKDQLVVSPLIGQPYILGQEFEQDQWWNNDTM